MQSRPRTSGPDSKQSGPPVHDGQDQLHPRSQQQLDELDDWITNAASAEIARRFVSAILDHIDSILMFPLAGRTRDDVRPGMRTSTFKKRTLVAYEVVETSSEVMINILGVVHGGQQWESALGDDKSDLDAGR